jgi:ligand-binding SRPBCC domain-containing protein
MKLYQYKRKQLIPVSLETAWRFFSDPGNLALITPPWLGFSIRSELPDKMYPGLIIAYKVSPLLGIKMNWITEITHTNEPHYFVDEQRFGPYNFWHHEHHFKAYGDTTEVTDIVRYGLPFPSSLINKLLVAGKLEKIFSYRSEVLERQFPAVKKS